MFKKFISFYKPYIKLLVADLFAAFLVSLTAMLYPIMTRKLLNVYIPNKEYKFIIIFGISLLLIYIFRAFLKYFIQYYGHLMGVNIQADMRSAVFKKIQRMPFTYFDENETGKIMSTMTNDLFEISELAHHGPENIVICTLMIGLSVVYLSSINMRLALITFASIPFLLLIAIKSRAYMRNASRKSKKAISSINSAIQSSVSGIRVTKAFGNSTIETEKFEKTNREYIEARKIHFSGFALFHASTGFVTDFFNVICLIAGGIFLYNGEISFGDYSTFIVSVNLFISPINTLVQFTEQLEEGIGGFERFVDLIERPVEEDKKDAKSFDKLNGDIVFENVNFAYSNEKEKVVLDDISFKVKEGSTVALVGESGGGKTTICHLLPRFYKVNSGSISIDGTNIEDITMESLRNNIGIVQQDVFLFSGSFYDNILYGRPDASEAEVIEAAKKANIYDYIMSLPNGFNTEVGERGVRLSGGQKQRLSIARVFLKNPPILLLDEATSALDNTTEIMIQEALDSLKEGRTTIVVAHRLSTIKNADRIIVISGGKIIEEGSHTELMNKDNGTYKKLHETQFNIV
ncbi:MAG: ABC transporter ATP-binding protein [Erysipelotrichaceae bacterium]|nr:ABC transporter ATP-binding protein [Erysipelotrichaceae bacterium]